MGGKITCTLGEVKNRADFIVYWGGNPAECHPRHFTKYTLTQKGKFVPLGRKGRTMVLVDIRETPSADLPLVKVVWTCSCRSGRARTSRS